VVTNLLSNSIKFTPDNGQVKIKAKAVATDGQPPNLEVCVSDTGIGIHPSDYEEIFKKFKQGETPWPINPEARAWACPFAGK
tara:strand:- start:9514 stop:9759 length:246 start_codon:yes stop_codon:yes gene_type:complete